MLLQHCLFSRRYIKSRYAPICAALITPVTSNRSGYRARSSRFDQSVYFDLKYEYLLIFQGGKIFSLTAVLQNHSTMPNAATFIGGSQFRVQWNSLEGCHPVSPDEGAHTYPSQSR
jgi:hypothetical protein